METTVSSESTETPHLKIDRKLSHSSMYCWRRCRTQYYFKYKMDYAPHPGPAMIKGSCGHEAMATWYNLKDKVPTEERIAQAMLSASEKLFEFEEDQSRSYAEEWELTEIVLNRYFLWSLENDDDFVVRAVEHRFDLVLDEVAITGFIDGIVEINGVNWLLEHKFMGQARTSHLELDPQVSIYLLAARKLGFNPRGVLYNVIRMRVGGIAETEPVIRLPVYRNNEGLKFIETELILQINEMADFHNKGGAVYRTETNNCSWDCGFYRVCLGMNDNGEYLSVLETMPRRKEKVDKDEKGE